MSKCEDTSINEAQHRLLFLTAEVFVGNEKGSDKGGKASITWLINSTFFFLSDKASLMSMWLQNQ